jgi:hypothetical protein
MSQERNTPEGAWKSQAEEQAMQIATTPDELCTMARSREKLNARVTAAVATVTVLLAAAFLYNVYRMDQPWLRLGQAWTLAVLLYLFGPALGGGRRRMIAGEPCAAYLERQHEERRSGYLRLRRRLFLLIPGMAMSWWGAPGAKPWLFVMTGTALALVWFAFGKAAEKAAQDREEVRRSVGD